MCGSDCVPKDSCICIEHLEGRRGKPTCIAYCFACAWRCPSTAGSQEDEAAQRGTQHHQTPESKQQRAMSLDDLGGSRQ